MTLLDAILKAKPHEEGKYNSPPPEVKSVEKIKKKRVRKFQYAHVPSRVDSSPPSYNPLRKMRKLEDWQSNLNQLFKENVQLLITIKQAYYRRGLVDCHWQKTPERVRQYYQERVDFLRKTRRENLALYKRILATTARVDTTAELNKEWCNNRRKIVEQASAAFVLFEPIPQEQMEDPAFKAAPGVKRPRVYIKLGVQEGAVMGEICVELFTDTCPNTCRLFLDLLDGDAHGYGYVNTCFFRKVPHLYWSGGDVIYNNGFGCYAQSGREVPIGAENYHYPHSMPGLLSMRVTVDDEMCGIFNITFKPLPQLDLRNVVFGRVIRPSSTYDIISALGNALSSRPVVEIRSTRRKEGRRWVVGAHNTKLAEKSPQRLMSMINY
ncbi:hypothetical protein PYW08_012580 [Mythimna loreyi]|uniref:Uncharacterized protein n=1 Tax=Mythimna loreyi TaxID=667449 RepID=A0ACC2Q2H0_9NEOP|nr:hypothetical protein PYW08_012580 [Mythimna loreyi]